jgi:hypothetical protein
MFCFFGSPPNGLTAAQLFQWRKAYLGGSLVDVGPNEIVVPASELQTRWCSDGLELPCDNGERESAWHFHWTAATGAGWQLPKALMHDWLET